MVSGDDHELPMSVDRTGRETLLGLPLSSESGYPNMTYKAWLKRHTKPVWPERAHIVSVVWDDATYAQEVEDSGLARAVTVGVIVEITLEYIKLASEFFADKTVRDVTTIPAGMVVEVHSLGEAEIPSPRVTAIPKKR